jgi:negative regulator of flagellin synthesis FlgM
MSSINGIGNTDATNPIQKLASQPIHKQIPADAPPARPADRVELSGVSHLLNALKSNDIRADKVAQIKAEIEAGTYETDDKLTAAADKLLDDLMR